VLRSHAGPADTVITFGLYVLSDLELSGFTLVNTGMFKAGTSRISDSRFDGDGVLLQSPFVTVEDGASVVLEDNTFENGSSGIRVDEGGSAVMCRNTIANNQYVGVIAWDPSSMTVCDNVISGHGNRAVVIGHFSSVPFTALVSGNTISGNHSTARGGGIQVNSPAGSDVIISDNLIIGNTCREDGAGIYAGRCTVANNVIQDNAAQGNGGGIRVDANTILTGNVIQGNHAINRGGGVYGLASGWEGTAPVIINGVARDVPRYSPCFPEPSNTYSGNMHGNRFGAWGPGEDNWCDDAGYDVYFP